MRFDYVRGATTLVVAGLIAVLLLSAVPGPAAAEPGTRQGELILKVGGQDAAKTRNLLPAIANDVWTSDVLFRVYGGPLLGHPTIDRPMAYIAKGTDVDEDGLFESGEYDEWREQANPDTPQRITIYYDFNGVRWHDGVQMTVWDLLFSYHVNAMNPRFNTDLRVLFCAGTASTYDAGGRCLNIRLAPKSWDGESNMAGDPNLRVALEFTLNEPFALFYESTLSPVLLPMHLWSRTGGGRHTDVNPPPPDGPDGLPDDYGCAVWIPPAEAAAKSIPECGTPTSTKWGNGIATTEPVPGSKPFTYAWAESWELTDADVIGSGPFRFSFLIAGSDSKVERFDDFYTGGTFDPQLAQVLKKPTIDGILFKVYRQTVTGVLALKNGDIDFYHWNVGGDYVSDLIQVPEIAVESNAEPGFFYMAYNMRHAPWGYDNNDPSNDVGYMLRKAISYLVDKKQIVQELLYNFGVIGHGVITPTNTFWYNNAIPKPTKDLTTANGFLNSAAAVAAGIGPDPAGDCSELNTGGCRTLPNIGKAAFKIYTPDSGYDPVRANAGNMIAASLRSVGLNAVAEPTSFGTIVNRINAHDFDVYILGWRIGGTDPDYMFSFFHSSNAAAGQNYGGFNNATFDAEIEASRTELNRDTRRAHVFAAQDILADSRPYEVLYFRTNIEGYRQDRFVNWSVNSGTIWGFWSLQGIKPPSTTTLRASVPVSDSAMVAGEATPVTVTVRDHLSAPLPGASVNLSVDKGNLTLLGKTGPFVVGSTNINGQITASYEASITVDTNVTVVVTAKATHPNYPDTVSTRSSVIEVFPPGRDFLSARLELTAGDVLRPGDVLPLSILVRDQARAVAGDAFVTVLVDPPGGLNPEPASGLASDLTQIVLTADESILEETDFTVTIVATKAGHIDATRSIPVTVLGTGIRCPSGVTVRAGQSCPGGLDVLLIAGGIVAVVAVVGGVWWWKRR